MKMDNLGRGRAIATAALSLVALIAGLLATSVATPALAADADDIGWVGLKHNLRTELVMGPSEKAWTSPKQDGWYVYGNFEGGVFGKVSPLGNLGGLEFGLAMGYDGASSSGDDVLSGSGAMLGAFMYDMYVGFPITLFHKFDAARSRDTLQIALAPGFGLNHMHVYAVYLKGRASMMLTESLTGELQYTWHPGPTSSVWGGNTGINQGSLRSTLFWDMDSDMALLASLEFTSSQREIEQSGKPLPGAFGGKNPFTTTLRGDFETATRFSVGLAF